MAGEHPALDELEALLEAIRGYSDPRRASNEWKQAYRILQKTDLPPARYNGIVGMRDVAGFEKLIDELESPETAPAPAAGFDADELRKALKAFRKRAKLTRLDDESKLGRGPLSKGSDSDLSAITPPLEWSDAVWQELVRQGRLKYLGHGMYRLAE